MEEDPRGVGVGLKELKLKQEFYGMSRKGGDR